MAETIVNLVLEKITDAVVKEVLYLWGVEKQVEKVKHELDWVQAFLKDADRKQIVNARQKQWVKEVRDVAYRIEDAIDTFLCEVPKRQPGKRECIKNIFRKIIEVPVIHNLGSEINEILETLKDIKERKETYGISTLGEGSGHGKRLLIRPPVLSDIEDSHVVGFDKEIDSIVSQLLDEGTARRSVVSIIGQGGLEKTTLAKKVYNRSMIQVVGRDYYDDSISSCRMHDILRDVAIQKAKEDNLLMVCSTLDEVRGCGKARRVAAHNVDCSELMKYASNNLRTLLCFNSKIPDCSGHKLLKVFGDINKYFDSDPIDMKCFDGLFQLKYLQFGHNWNFTGNQGSYEKVIGSMKSLQTLIVDLPRIIDFLPNCLWDIKTLRHISLPEGVLDIPQLTSTTDLPNLQTICKIKTHESWEYANLPNLPNLRGLSIENTEGIPWGLVVAFLRTLKYLTRLTIRGKDIPTEVIDMKEFPFYQNLTHLAYMGRLSCPGLNFTMFPTHLVFLELSESKLQKDPMPMLEKLKELKMLSLDSAYQKQTMKKNCTLTI